MQPTALEIVNHYLKDLKLTQAEQLELQALDNQQKVCELLHWNEFMYNQFVQNCGRNYLHYLLNGDVTIVTEIEQHPVFWQWWKMHWISRDTAYTDVFEDLQLLHPKARLEIYINTHHALYLAKELVLDGKLLGDSYAKMIANIFKNNNNSNE